MNKDITYDQVHTKEKQELLKVKMNEVAELIHKKYSLPEKVHTCPVCLSKKINFYVNKFGFNMDRCNDCNHIFTNPFPSEDALNFYYNSDLKKFENKFFEDSFEERIPIFAKRIEIINKLLDEGTILDVGSSIGIFIEGLKRNHTKLEITACDLNIESCEKLKQKYKDIKVIHGDVLKIEETKKFEIITLWDTFEHIVSPKELLEKILNLLKPNGFFIFSTPNTASYEWKIMNKEHIQLLPPGHVNLYNKDNIKLLATRHKFNVLDVLTLNASLDLTYVKKEIDLIVSKNQINEQLSNFINYQQALLENPLIFDSIASYLISQREAGNMVVILQK